MEQTNITVIENVNNQLVNVTESNNIVEIEIINPSGSQGPAGPGLPAGGSDGQLIFKSGSADYDTEWITSPYVESGSGVSNFQNDANYTVSGSSNSQFTNDENYISEGDNISELNNDANYTTSGSAISQFDNDASYTPSGSNISQFANDADYIESGSNISELNNDENYITSGSGVTELSNDANYIISGSGNSQLDNDSDYIQSGSAVSQLANDADYVVSGSGNSQFINDENFIISGSGNSQLENDSNYVISGSSNSQFVNDENYIASGSNISQLANDAGYLTTVSGSNISIFNNDTGYITTYNVTEGDVTQYQGALFVSASQIVDLPTYQLLSEKGQALGYVPLNAGAKIAESYLPDSILGQVSYQGTYNASTNTPTLAGSPASNTKGEYYVVDTAGTQFTIEFAVGDWIISNGTSWQKVDNSDAVTTVFGRMGNIIAVATDYDSFYLSKAENLNDLPNKTTARTNLDVYSKSEVNSNFYSTSNPSNFITSGSNISQLNNNNNFVPSGSAISEFDNDKNYTISGSDVSQFANDANYVVSGSSISEFNNDINYVISGSSNSQFINDENYTVSGSSNSQFTNDEGYITSFQNNYVETVNFNPATGLFTATRLGLSSLSSSFDGRYALSSSLSNYQLTSEKGVAGGYVPLNGSGIIDTSYLPSFVDDVLEYADLAAFPATGETGKLYVALDTNFIYRWSGSTYVQVGGGGAGLVDSVFGRVGGITAEVGDYSAFYLGIDAKAADSNLLDALDSTEFLRSIASDYSGDLNDITINGKHRITTGATNFPSGATTIGSTLINYTWDANAAKQVYYEYNTDRIFTRRKVNTWQPWVETWTSGNDGAGSGLDADTLDGLQGSQFLRSDTNSASTGNITAPNSITNETDSFGDKTSNIITLTQAQYDGITPDDNTLYFII